MESTIAAAIFDRLKCNLPQGVVAPEIGLQTGIRDLPLDSLDLLEIVYELEEQFDTTVDEQALVMARNVEDLIRMFVNALEQKS